MLKIYAALLFISLMISSTTWAQPYGVPGSQVPIYKSASGGSEYGFHLYLPIGYKHGTADKYPLVVFLHGLGEQGDGNIGNCATETNKSLWSGLCEVTKNGAPLRLQGSFDVPAIVVSPQTSTYWVSDLAKIDRFITFIEERFEVDSNRIHITGMSMGGAGTMDYSRQYHQRVASVVAVCHADNTQTNDINLRGKPVWFFHAYNDSTTTFSKSVNVINGITPSSVSVLANAPYRYDLPQCVNKNSSGQCLDKDGVVVKDAFALYSQAADQFTWYDNTTTTNSTNEDHMIRFTLFASGGHNSWTRAYNDQNMWNWMLAQSLDGSDIPPVVNVAPVANAGSDRTIQLPENSIVLNGSASDSDGAIASYAWSKISGPNVSLSGQNSANLSLSNLVEGNYVFRLTASDDDGATHFDEVGVSVLAAVVVNPPVSSGSYLKLGGPSYGKVNLKYYAGADGSSTRVYPKAMGHNMISFSIKNVGGAAIDLSKYKIEILAGYNFASVVLGNYLPSLSSDWQRVTIPIADFPFSTTNGRDRYNEGVHAVTIQKMGGAGDSAIGVDEVRFEGGATPLVYYGDSYEASGSLTHVTYSLENQFKIIERLASGGHQVGNQLPILIEIADQFVSELQQLVLRISSSDPDGDNLILGFAQDLPNFMSFVDNGDGTGDLTIEPQAGDTGTYELQAEVTDENGGSRSQAFVVNILPGLAQSYLKLGGPSYGKVNLKYYAGADGSSTRVYPKAMGHNMISFSIKNVGGAAIDLSKYKIEILAGYNFASVVLGNYLPSLSSDWQTVSIPIADFPFSTTNGRDRYNEGVHAVTIQKMGGAGDSAIGVDEVRFEGGAAPLVYYGDSYEASGSLSNVTYSYETQFKIIERPTSGGSN
ncbi:MAG: dienelactone hydrolase family protein [Bacteriovoracaceae bacterium]|nr:dienelactone hydrolase family protein [Bacteriovoracaceae bacterium]